MRSKPAVSLWNRWKIDDCREGNRLKCFVWFGTKMAITGQVCSRSCVIQCLQVRRTLSLSKHNLNKSIRLVCSLLELLSSIFFDSLLYLQFTRQFVDGGGKRGVATNRTLIRINYDRTNADQSISLRMYITLGCWENKFTTEMKLADSSESRFMDCSTGPVWLFEFREPPRATRCFREKASTVWQSLWQKNFAFCSRTSTRTQLLQKSAKVLEPSGARQAGGRFE